MILEKQWYVSFSFNSLKADISLSTTSLGLHNKFIVTGLSTQYGYYVISKNTCKYNWPTQMVQLTEIN